MTTAEKTGLPIGRLRSRIARFFNFGYDAVEDKGRRRPPRVRQLAEDDELTAVKRKKLTATARDLPRSYEVAAWAIRKHLDYVSRFSFQSRTGDDALDRRIEELVKWWSRPRNFDVAGRHSMRRFTRLLEACRTIDGDVFTLKLSSGMVQGIEGTHIRTPASGLPGNLKPNDLVHGVQTTKAGRAKSYSLCQRRQRSDSWVFDRMVPAQHLLPLAYYTRFDQVRGVSPLATAINRLQDTYENFDYALAKAKVTQLFALAFYREADAAAGDVTGAPDEGEDEDKSGYEVDFGKGPIQLDLDPGDRAEFLESHQPASEFQTFSQQMIAVALKALDIPLSFFDESFTNYSGQRQALLLYEQSAEDKRDDVREFLDALIAWRLGLFVLDGVLSLPGAMTLPDLQWEWVPAGLPWIDPLKEISADAKAVELGVTSRQRICKRTGADFWTVQDELDAEAERMAKRANDQKVAA